MTAEELTIWRNMALVPLVLACLQLLAVLQCREWVKTDLRSRLREPVSIRWRPFYWWPTWGPCFRVVYRDLNGMTHRGLCGAAAWTKPIVWREEIQNRR